MGNNMIPKNYEVYDSNGLKGIDRINKNGSRKEILPALCYNAMVVRPYGRIFIAYTSAFEPGLWVIMSSSGAIKTKMPIVDVMFGSNAIFVRVMNPRPAWCLLDKDLNIVNKTEQDFEFSDYRDTKMLPDGRGTVMVTGADGNKMMFNVNDCSLARYKPKEFNRVVKKVQVHEDSRYKVSLDCMGNSVMAVGENDASVKFERRTSGVSKHTLKIVSKLTSAEKEVDEEEFLLLRNVKSEEWKEMDRLLSTIENGHSTIPIVLAYLNECKGKDMLGRAGFKCVHQSLTRNFSELVGMNNKFLAKVYIYNGSVFLLIMNEYGRISTLKLNPSELPDGVIVGSEDIMNANEVSECAVGRIRLISKLNMSAKQRVGSGVGVPEGVNSKFGKNISKEIKEYWYEDAATYAIDCEVNGHRFGFGVAILNGFAYTPKSNTRSSQTKVYVARTNHTKILSQLYISANN